MHILIYNGEFAEGDPHRCLMNISSETRSKLGKTNYFEIVIWVRRMLDSDEPPSELSGEIIGSGLEITVNEGLNEGQKRESWKMPRIT